MGSNSESSTAISTRQPTLHLSPDRYAPLRLALLLLACFLPLFGSLSYFNWAADRDSMRIYYSLSKAMQFSLPIIVWALFRPGLAVRFKRLFEFSLRSQKDRIALLYGALSATLILATGYMAYNLVFKDTLAVDGVKTALTNKLVDFGVYSVTDYWVLAFFIAVVHSFLEEYYWRAYVCTEIENTLGSRMTLEKRQLVAILTSSIAFTLHHIVVITHYAQVTQRLPVILLATLVVFACGILWASLFVRYRNIYAAWLSHIAADLVMVGIGYDILYRSI